MKILFLAPFGIRPKGTLLARMLPLAVELQKLGHEVVVVAPPYTNPKDSDTTEVVNGVRIVNICLSSAWKPLATLAMSWRMYAGMRRESPDIVHLFKPKGYGGLAAMLLVFLEKIGFRLPPLFVDTDDWEGEGGMNDLLPYSVAEKWFFAFQEKWILRRAVTVTVASRELQTLVLRLGVSVERSIYIPNGVYPLIAGKALPVRRMLGIAPEAPVLLLYTRFFEFSQERLHNLFAEVFRSRPDVQFLVVGKGRNNEEQSLLTAGEEAGYLSSIFLAGWVEPDDLPDYIATADVAVYLFDDTLLNRAKCPAKLTELLNIGIPVVADSVGQIAEYIMDGDTGILCTPGDYMAMAASVCDILSDHEQRVLLGDAAKARMQAMFNWSNLVSELGENYAKAA